MDPIQKSSLIVFLQDMLRQKEKEHQEDRELLTDIKNQLSEALRNQKESISNPQNLEKKIADLQMQLAQEKAENSTLRYDNETLKARLEINQKQQFDTKCHDRRKSKKKNNKGEEQKSCYHGPSRLGATYNKEISEVAIKIGSRKAEILKEFLGDAKIRSLQSDSCSSYLYLDDNLIDIIHLLIDAVTYFDNAWDQVFAYRLNGDFTTFNTFIQTCKQVGVPFMSYFKKVMNVLKNGRTDYQNLLPDTIQI